MTKHSVDEITSGDILSLSADVRLRREYFGGLAFNTASGDILELDKAAYRMLVFLENKIMLKDEMKALLVKESMIRKDDPQFEKVVKEMLYQRVITMISGHPPESIMSESVNPFHGDNTVRQWLSAPETVHWALTYRCSKDCPECYARRFRQDGHELSLDDSLKVVDRLADWGVFQLALGGGEPFEKEGFREIVSHASDSGLAVHVTTGRKNLNNSDIAPLAGRIKALQIGFSTRELCEGSHHAMKGNLSNTNQALKSAGISPGANIILSKAVIRNLKPLIEEIVSAGFDRIVFIRYKPPVSESLWKNERPDRDQLLSLHRKIITAVRRYPALHLRTDCALSFLQRHIPDREAKYAGLKGCVAGDRILALSPDGGMYPCSQLVSGTMRAGNILLDDPQEIWDESGILKRYRYFRNGNALKESSCGQCTRKDTCGGCRVFAHDALGRDPGCPEPVPVPAGQMNKEGRLLDVREFLKKAGGITAWEYRDRYGVGEKRAIRELNMLTGMKNRSPKYRYADPRDDVISAIQDLTGYTSGGVPFAGSDLVSEWIEDETDDYPRWIASDQVYIFK